MVGKQKPSNITCILNIEKTKKKNPVTIKTEINVAIVIITQSFSNSCKFDSVSEWTGLVDTRLKKKKNNKLSY